MIQSHILVGSLSTISIPVVAMASIALYVGLYHLAIYSRRRQNREDLTFALLCFSIVFYDVFCVGLYNVNSVIEGALWQRAQFITLAVFVPAFLWFVADYAHQKPGIATYLFSAFYLVALVVQLVDRSDLTFLLDQPSIKQVALPHIQTITYYETTFGPFTTIQSLMGVVASTYILIIAIRYFQRGHKREAMPLLLALGCMYAASFNDTLVGNGAYDFIYLMEYAFLAVILLMAYSLSNMVVKAAMTRDELRKSEERFRSLVETTNDWVWEVDVNGIYTYTSPQVRDLLGYVQEEILGRTVFDIMPEDEAKRVRVVFQGMMHSQRPLISVENIVRCKDGQLKVLETSGVPFFDNYGRLLGYRGIDRDITERKQAEEALRESEQKFRLFVEQSSDALVLTDENGIIIEWNQAQERLTDITRRESVGQPLWEIQLRMLPEIRRLPELSQKTRQEVLQALQSGQGDLLEKPMEIELSHSDGTKVIIQQMAFSIKTNQGYRLGSIGRDITKLKQTEAQIERTLQETHIRFEVSRALAGAETENEVLDTLIQHAGLYPQALVTIFTFDKGGDELVAILRRQNPFDSSLTPVMSIGEGLPASRYTLFSHFLADHPLVSEDVWVDERFEPAGREILRQTGVASYAAIPLTAGSEWMGYIAAMAKSTGYFDEEKQHLYQTLAEQGAVALRAVRLREKIRESQQRLSLLLQQSPLAVIEWNTDFKVVDWNPAAERIFGYMREEALGSQVDLIVSEAGRPEVDQLWQALLAQKGGTYSIFENLTKDGCTITCEWFNAPLVGAGGEIIGVASLVRDITEHKKAEQALRESEERLRQIASSLREVIWLRDARTRQVLYVNPAFEELTGRTCENFYENRDIVIDVIHPDDKEGVIKALKQRFDGVPYDKEHRIVHLDGSVRWVSSRIFPVRNEADEVYRWASIMEDITDQKRAEEEIRRLNEELELRVIERTAQLEAANKELEAFSYSVSHDLRAPLRAIDGFSRILIKDHASQLPSEVVRLLEIVRSNTQQMGRLIDGLLAFSRLSRQPVDKRTVNMGDLVRDVLDILQGDLEGRGVEIKIEHLPACWGDPLLLRQVWMNLLSNALKFTREREMAQIEIGYKEVDGEQVYFVKDNGVGFDMQYVDKLFGVFQRLHRDEKFEGTGVGLAIAQRIVQRHDGRVWMEGVVDQGVTSYFALPRKRS